MSDRPAPEAHYLLGHTDNELRRLELQDRVYRGVTRRALLDAGVEPGMRVLDIGCGTGGVSRLTAEIVGPGGSVLGVDRSEKGLAYARSRSDELGVANVDFVAAELDAFVSADAFDAVVGRFILMHQADPAATLATVAQAVRPDGLVIMLESCMEALEGGVHSHPTGALYDRIVRWKSDVVRGAGADTWAGYRLPSIFAGAGLGEATVRVEAGVVHARDDLYFDYVAESVRSMLPEAARIGLDGFTGADVETVAQRLRAEVTETDGVLVTWPVASAWARRP